MKNIITKIITLILLLVTSSLWGPAVTNAAPNLVNYQGSLTDSGGTPVPDGSYSMVFRIFDVTTGGTPFWEESQTVTTSNGIYNVLLGSGTTITGSFDPALFSTDNLWLEVEVNAEVLTPRQQVTSVAFALQAEEAATAGDADTVDGSHAVDFAATLHTHPGADITSQVGDADTVDGAHAAALEESAEIDADILAHTGAASAHHTRYDDPEAVTAMGTLDNANPLNHERRTGGQVFNSVLSRDGTGSTLDADLLDGLNSSAFMSSGADNWVNTTGDTMTGGLNVLGNVGIGTATPSYNLDVRGGVNGTISYFYNDNNASGYAYGIYSKGDAIGTGNGSGTGGLFYGYGGSSSGNAYGTYQEAYAYGSSTAYGVYSDATGGTTTGNEYAFYGLGDGYFSGNVGIGTTSPGQKLSVAGTIESTSGGIKFPDGTTQTTTATSGSFYGKVAIVAQSGGDYTDPKTAMDDLAAWCGTPGAANPCLVRIMPGVYDLGNNALTMQPYVDVEGSGENTTIITSTHSSGSADANSATVVGADNAEIRFLTVENLGGSTYALAVYNNSASPKITNVTATALGGAFSYGVYNSSSSPTMTNVTTTASGGTAGYGVRNDSSSPAMTNVTATASGGTFSRGVWNLSSSSPTMTNVTATALGGGASSGVRNDSSSSPTMTNVTATASGGSDNRGVYNSSSSPTMTNVTATASGGTFSNYGVYNASSSPTMTNVTTTASGGSDSYGVLNASSSPTMKEVSSNGIVINGNLLFVPASGTFGSVNGALLRSVDNEIAGLGAPSATNRYVIKLDAGIYDLGNNALTMQPYVDVEGSGENTTTITSTHSSGSADANSATVVGADNAEIRFLTVENRGGGSNQYVYAVYNNSVSPKITNVRATASGGTSSNFGVWNSSGSSPTMTNVTATALGGAFSAGVLNGNSSSPTMTNVTATASGGTSSYGVSNSVSSSPSMTNVTATATGGTNNRGVDNWASSPTMTNVTATASGGTSSYGVYNSNLSSPTIKNCSISGTTNSINNISSSAAKVGATMLDGPVTGTGFYCVGAYDASFTALGSGCL